VVEVLKMRLPTFWTKGSRRDTRLASLGGIRLKGTGVDLGVKHRIGDEANHEASTQPEGILGFKMPFWYGEVFVDTIFSLQDPSLQGEIVLACKGALPPSHPVGEGKKELRKVLFPLPFSRIHIRKPYGRRL
jgi:hypothetical protein